MGEQQLKVLLNRVSGGPSGEIKVKVSTFMHDCTSVTQSTMYNVQ